MPRLTRNLIFILFAILAGSLVFSFMAFFITNMRQSSGVIQISSTAVSLGVLLLIFISHKVIIRKQEKKSTEQAEACRVEINEYRAYIKEMAAIFSGIHELITGKPGIKLPGEFDDKDKIRDSVMELKSLIEKIEMDLINKSLENKKEKHSLIDIYKKIPDLAVLLKDVIKETEKATFNIIENFEKVSLENSRAKDESRKNLEKIKNEIGNKNIETFLEESKNEIGNYEDQINSLLSLFNDLLKYNKEDEKKLLKFGEWIDNIGEILNSINEISEKNRLIAINTSIEASKFGERGRGFNVLTLEIQKLNESTNAFIKNINRIMDSFREYNKSFINEWSMRTEDMIGKIEKNENLSEKIISRLVNSYSLSTTSFINLSDSTDKIADSLNKLLESLQFQDIIKQQIEKVIAFLNQLGGRMELEIQALEENGEAKSINEIVEKNEIENKVILF